MPEPSPASSPLSPLSPSSPSSPARRRLLRWAALPLLPAVPPAAATGAPRPRVRPGDAGWPAAADWQQLAAAVGDGWLPLRSPFEACRSGAAPASAGASTAAPTAAPTAEDCAAWFASLRNPYRLGDDPALTQTLGWVDAWTSRPSACAVAARSAADVAAAVDFARRHRLRLVVKGGGHSYQGTSCAPDSLLVWTRRMNAIRLHEAFVPEGMAGTPPVPAVSVGAGATWGAVYDAVTTRHGAYVQGGGCMTVGVAGLVHSGGFGSFSKAFGSAASHLLEAEVVTADGRVRIANPQREPELFWALKGGGGGAMGVTTRLTLKLHPLPQTFGAVNLRIEAASPAAYRRLIGLALDFCAGTLAGPLAPHWGEQLRFRRDDSLVVAMVFQGLSRAEAAAAWQPFFDAVEAVPGLRIGFSPLRIVTTPARDFWAPTLLKRSFGFIARDDRPGAPPTNVFWPGDQGQAGQVLHGYGSTWLPAALLQPARRAAFADALFAATRHWSVALHLNKGLAGAPAAAVEAARDTAMNPAVLDAFALLITGAEGPPAYPGIDGHEPDVALARRRAAAIREAMAAIRTVVPDGGAYLSESDYFQADWQRAFWGAHHERLAAAKQQYDPEGLFFTHHGVGSEAWSDDGFMPRTG